MSLVFDPVSNSEGEQIAVSCTMRNGLRIEILNHDGCDWECFDFDTAEQAELVADHLRKAASVYRADLLPVRKK